MCIVLLACSYNIFIFILKLSPADGRGAVAPYIIYVVAVTVTMWLKVPDLLHFSNPTFIKTIRFYKVAFYQH